MKRSTLSSSPNSGNTFVGRSIIDHILSVEEELRMNGFDVKMIKEGHSYLIELDTVAGKMKYSCSEKTVIGDYYRFISHYGSKLHTWALAMKLGV